MDVSPLVLFLVVLIGLIERGLSIKCYNCNSSPFKNGQYCKELPNRSSYEIDCDLFKKNYTKCRKVVQRIGKDIRIIRQCASTASKDGCEKRVGTNDIKMEYCHCDKNRCNQAVRATSPNSRFLLYGIAAVVTVITKVLHNIC